jgi:hypothetical protein
MRSKIISIAPFIEQPHPAPTSRRAAGNGEKRLAGWIASPPFREGGAVLFVPRANY